METDPWFVVQTLLRAIDLLIRLFSWVRTRKSK